MTENISNLFKFSVDDYYRLADVGILTREDKVELIEGQIVVRNPDKSPAHSACVTKLGDTLRLLLSEKVIISTHNPIRLSNFTEPEPDLAVLNFQSDYYHAAHPIPKDILIAIEVSHTTQKYDRETKVPLYAQYDIPETWVIDLATKTIEVYSKPIDGKYGNKQTFRRGDVLESGFVEGLLVFRMFR